MDSVHFEDILYINVVTAKKDLRERKRIIIHSIFNQITDCTSHVCWIADWLLVYGSSFLSLCTSGRCNSSIKQPANWSVNASVHTIESWYYINSPRSCLQPLPVLPWTPTEIQLFLARSLQCLKAIRGGNLFLKEDVREGNVSNGFEFRILDSLKARTWKARKCSMEFKTVAFGL